eukprot:GILK01004938.1.p1 GENE.GILK01004938.1~~GILK01004938.1.p1  ORF type:complete len:999 (+),score=141.30 GILK01004938.1:54-2999(+)
MAPKKSRRRRVTGRGRSLSVDSSVNVIGTELDTLSLMQQQSFEADVKEASEYFKRVLVLLHAQKCDPSRHVDKVLERLRLRMKHHQKEEDVYHEFNQARANLYEIWVEEVIGATKNTQPETSAMLSLMTDAHKILFKEDQDHKNMRIEVELVIVPILKVMFVQLDKESTGRVSAQAVLDFIDEHPEFMERLTVTLPYKPDVNRLQLSNADADHDGFVTFEELKSLFLRFTAKEVSRPRLTRGHTVFYGQMNSDIDGTKAWVEPSTIDWKERLRHYARKRFPIQEWLPTYNRELFRKDLMAGLTTGICAVPKGMAFAFLAGLAPQTGLFAAFLPALIYVCLGTSRHMGVAPTALVSLLTRAAVLDVCSMTDFPFPADDLDLDAESTMDTTDTANCTYSQYLLLVVALNFLVGCVFVIMGFCRFGIFIDFLSKPVLSGFTSAAAIIIAISQLKYLFFYSTHVTVTEIATETLLNVIKALDHFHWPTFLAAVCWIVLLLVLHKYKYTKHIYSVLVVLVATLSIYILGGVAGVVQIDTVGKVPRGMPTAALPVLTGAIFKVLWMPALKVTLVGFVEAMGAAKTYAVQMKYEVRGNQEMIAFGFANMFGSMFRCMPALCSIGNTSLLVLNGGQTPIALLISAFIVALTVALLTSLFFYLPQSALAVVIIYAVGNLVDVKIVTRLFKVNPFDLGLVLVTFASTLWLGVNTGMLISIGLSLVHFLYRCSKPSDAELGRIPGTVLYQDIKRHPSAYTFEGVFVYRFDSAIFFANANRFKKRLIKVMRNPERITKGVVVEGSVINSVDCTGMEMLVELHKEYTERGHVLVFGGFNEDVLETFKRAKVYEQIGPEHFFRSVHEAVKSVIFRQLQQQQQQNPRSSSPINLLVRSDSFSFRSMPPAFLLSPDPTPPISKRKSMHSELGGSVNSNSSAAFTLHEDQMGDDTDSFFGNITGKFSSFFNLTRTIPITRRRSLENSLLPDNGDHSPA